MMNWFDIVIVIALLVAFFNGYRKGLVMQLAGLVTVILAAVFGGRLARIILPELQNFFENMSPNVATVLSYIIAFMGIALVISLIAGVIQGLFKVVNLNFINRLLGSIIALATTMIVLSLLLNLVLMLDSQQRIIKPEIKENSFFYEKVQAVVPAIVPYLNKETFEKYVPENYREQIEENQPKAAQVDSAFQDRYFETDPN